MLQPIAVDKHAIPMSNVATHTKQMMTTSDVSIVLNIHAMLIRLENIDSKDKSM